MYEVNDVIVYENGGVCRIKEISVPTFLKTEEEYYTMERIGENGGTNYIKIENDKILMRSVITKLEAERILLEAPNMNALYHENEKIRDKEFKEIFKGCECDKYIKMLKGIYGERNRRSKIGKRINMSDERYLKRVEKLLGTEFSIVFDVTVDQAKLMINDVIN